jgi:uncharacterized membrane protein YcaP (DUF421 family)
MPELLFDTDWRSLLLGKEKLNFLFETALRTAIMFTVILLSFRVLGKRGIKQLSVFELGVIVGLGSAAGDPMFYSDVGLLHGILVFAIVLSFYRFITFLINRSSRIEKFVEGQPTVIVEEGCFLMANFESEPIAQDEFFAQLRIHNVSHLGQVKYALLETNGEVSIFYAPDDEVKYGLPVIPKLYDKKVEAITEEGHYACSLCANTEYLAPTPSHICPVCQKKTWVKAINDKRIH